MVENLSDKERSTRMSYTDDKDWVNRCTASFRLVTERESTLELTIECLQIQMDNTIWMQEHPEKRILKRERNSKGKAFTDGMKKAVEAEKKSIQFFIDHREKIRNKIIELQAKPELDRQKCVAFAMGHHVRLGTTSYVTQLEPELIRAICGLVI